MLEAQCYDLILLGRKTFFRFETQTNPDETLHELIKLSPRPVVAVPDVSHCGEAVVVAYDGSLQAARCYRRFAAWASASSARCTSCRFTPTTSKRRSAPIGRWTT